MNVSVQIKTKCGFSDMRCLLNDSHIHWMDLHWHFYRLNFITKRASVLLEKLRVVYNVT